MNEKIEHLKNDNKDRKNGKDKNNFLNTLSSLRNKEASPLGNINRYKSKRNNNSLDDDGNNLSMKRNSSNNFSRNMTNHLANKVSSVHPALRALNTARNVISSNSFLPRSNILEGNSTDNISDKIDDDSDSVSDDNLDNDSSYENESNSSILDNISSKTKSTLPSFLGNMKIFGSFPPVVKVILIILLPFIGLLILLLPFIIIFAMFSGLFGVDDSTSLSTNMGQIDYNNYNLSSDGHTILHESLDTFLASKGSSVNSLNNLISNNVNKAGVGTREGVVAAAVTLIGELGNNYNVKIPYFWGGGHGQISTLSSPSWGSSSCHTFANGASYNYCGLDCSGFVTWAIYNGGYKITPHTAGTFQNLPSATHVSLTNSAILKPGDLLESSSHVILIVGVDLEANQYICAEASGLQSGVLFSRKAFNDRNYFGVNMEGYYNNQSQKRS